MRVNVKRALEAFMTHGRYNGRSIRADGSTVFSYGTAILTYDSATDRYIFNATRYSITTTTQQNSIRAHFGSEIVEPGRRWVEVDGLRRGADEDDLIEAAQQERYTVSAGRTINRDGKPFITIGRCNETRPVEADEMTHRLCDLLNNAVEPAQR